MSTADCVGGQAPRMKHTKPTSLQPGRNSKKSDSVANGSSTKHSPPYLPELFPRDELDDNLLHWLHKASEFFDFDPKADPRIVQLSFLNLRVPIPAYSLARIYAVISTKAHHENVSAASPYRLSLAEQIALGVILWTFREASFGKFPPRCGLARETCRFHCSCLGFRCHCQVPYKLGIFIQNIERAPCVLLCNDDHSTRDAESLLQGLLADPSTRREHGYSILATLDSTAALSNVRMPASFEGQQVTIDRFLISPPRKGVLDMLHAHDDWVSGSSDIVSLHFPSIEALHDPDGGFENVKFVFAEMFLIVNLEKFENAITFGQTVATMFDTEPALNQGRKIRHVRVSGTLRALVLCLVGIPAHENDEISRIIEEVSDAYLPYYNFQFV